MSGKGEREKLHRDRERVRGKNREREKTRERVKKGRVKRDGPNPPEGKAHPVERGVRASGGTLSHDAADAGATGNGQGG